MAALDWAGVKQALGVALAQLPPPYNTFPADFDALLPRSISYSEARITQNCPLLGNRTQNSTLSTTSGIRSLTLSSITPTLVVPESLALITPAGSAPTAGTRVPYDKAELAVIDMIWPTEATTAAPSLADWNPRFWAMKDDHTIVIAPTPNGTYVAEITGLFAPATLSSTNTSTYLSTNYSDALVAGCMVFMEGTLKRNFGAQSDDPKQALSWEGEFQKLLANLTFEEARRRGIAPDMPRKSG